MGLIKWKSNFAIGGSVQLGADTNIYRKAANQLATDDGMHVAGTVGVVGASVFTGGAQFSGTVGVVSTSQFTGAVTTNGGVNSGSGTPFVLPYTTASPTLDTNGDMRIYHKAAVPYLVLRSGGTSYAMAFPAATDGTVTITVNSVP